jgi:hypothetical protein
MMGYTSLLSRLKHMVVGIRPDIGGVRHYSEKKSLCCTSTFLPASPLAGERLPPFECPSVLMGHMSR